jgi:uncharacterized membrane protein YraQ (UPF0718 family)
MKKFKRHPDWMTLIFSAAALAGAAGIWHSKGTGAVVEVLGTSLLLLAQVAPIVLAALLVGAYVQRLVPQETVERLLGGHSGLRGLLTATAAGAVTPGGPFAAFSLVVALRNAGAAFGVCVAYLTSWSVLGLNRILVWEAPFLGMEFTLTRVAVSLPVPLIAGLIARRLMIRRFDPERRD